MSKKELRELDAWIAEHLFGWQWFEKPNPYENGKIRKGLFPPDNERYIRFNFAGFAPASPTTTDLFSDWDRFGAECGEDGFSKPPHGVPRYTTDSAAAMEVLKHCAEVQSGSGPVKVEWTGVRWMVCYNNDPELDELFAEASTLELAICLFAKTLF